MSRLMDSFHMRWLTFLFLFSVGILLWSSGMNTWAGEEKSSLRAITLPTDPISYQPGPGQEVANIYCLICHSADYVYTQPFHSQEKWQEIVKKMQIVFGCPIPDDQISRLAAYLSGQNSVTPESLVNHP